MKTITILTLAILNCLVVDKLKLSGDGHQDSNLELSTSQACFLYTMTIGPHTVKFAS